MLIKLSWWPVYSLSLITVSWKHHVWTFSYICLTLFSNYLTIGNLSSSSFLKFKLDSSFGLPTKPQTVHYISERIIRNPHTFLLKFHSKPVIIWSSRFKPSPPLNETVFDLHCMLAHSQHSVFILWFCCLTQRSTKWSINML